MKEKQEIERLLNLDNDELLLLLGNEIRGLGASPAPRRQILQQAKIWLTEKNHALRNAICKDKNILLLANKDKSEGDLVMLISVIADLIVSVVSGISPIAVAILITREGLLKYCEIFWNTKSS